MVGAVSAAAAAAAAAALQGSAQGAGLGLRGACKVDRGRWLHASLRLPAEGQAGRQAAAKSSGGGGGGVWEAQQRTRSAPWTWGRSSSWCDGAVAGQSSRTVVGQPVLVSRLAAARVQLSMSSACQQTHRLPRRRPALHCRRRRRAAAALRPCGQLCGPHVGQAAKLASAARVHDPAPS